MEVNKKEARKSICCVLNAFEACMSLIVHKGEFGAVGTTDKAAVGYYLVKWLSKPYTLHADTEGMSGIIFSRKMVVDALYFNPVHRAQNWYTPSAVSHYDGRGGKAYLVDGLASAANQREKCAATRMREDRGNAEEGHEGIVSGPRGDHGVGEQI